MANTNAPNGFQEYSVLDGAPANFGVSSALMLGNQSVQCFQGDIMVMGNGTNTGLGYLYPGNVTGITGAAIAGIFISCSWQSVAQKKLVYSNYWPAGNDTVANTTVSVKLASHPNNLYIVQAKVGPIGQGNVSQYYNYAAGTGNTNNGISGMTLDDTTGNTTAGALPFQVVRILGQTALGSSPIGNGGDPTTAYNRVIVRAVNLIAGI